MQRGYDPHRIAVLAEDETAYGGSEIEIKDTPRDVHEKGCSWGCQVQSADPQDRERIQRAVVRAYFPREIAQLRSAYQREAATAAPGGNEKESYRSILKRDLGDAGSDDDSVHAYSQRQLPLSQEGTLLSIVTTLNKHGVEFVILRATDPLDEVFLARYLSKASPDVRIVTAGNDLLLRREIEDRLLFGILSISTYSMRPGADDLLPNPQYWSVHQERVFPSFTSIGTYNAMTALLAPDKNGEPVTSRGRIQIDSIVRLEEYGWPALGGPVPDGNSGGVPPVWVTVLGRDGFWPVTLLTPMPSWPDDPVSQLPLQDQRSGSDSYKSGKKPSATLAWKVLCVVTIAIAILYTLFLLRGSILSTSQISHQFAVRKDDCRFRVFAIQGLLLVAALFLVLWPMMFSLVQGCYGWAILFLVTAGVLICVLVLDLLTRGAEQLSRFSWVLGSIVSFALAAILLILVLDDKPVENMFVYRYVHTAWWVSPLTPLLFLIGAGLWWAWHTIQGTALTGERRTLLPRAVEAKAIGDPPKSVLTELKACFKKTLAALGLKEREDNEGRCCEEKLNNELCHLSEDDTDVRKLLQVLTPGTWNHRVHWALLVFLIFAMVLTDFCHPVSSLEGPWYDRLVGISMLMLLAGLFSSLLRLHFIWADTKRLLLRLDCTPLREGFRRLSGFPWMPFWGLGAGPLPDRERLARFEAHALRTATNTVNEKAQKEKESENEKMYQIQLAKQLNAVEGALYKLTANLKPLETPNLKSTETANLLPGQIANLERHEHLRAFYSAIAGATAVVLRHLQLEWHKDKYKEPPSGTHTEGSEIRCEWHVPTAEELASKRSRDATNAAEDFVALVYASFIQVILIRTRSLIICVCGMFVFLVLALNSYPFEPRGTLGSLSILLLMVILGVIGLAFTQIRRDATLSLITDTKPGELGSDFWLKAAQFAALPLLSLLAAHYPEIGSFFFSWMEPAARALK
jgi:hypothetical protein